MLPRSRQFAFGVALVWRVICIQLVREVLKQRFCRVVKIDKYLLKQWFSGVFRMWHVYRHRLHM